MDGIVEILISPACRRITIMLVSVFSAGPQQVNFKQTALRQTFCPVCNRRASSCRVHGALSRSAGTQERQYVPFLYRWLNRSSASLQHLRSEYQVGGNGFHTHVLLEPFFFFFWYQDSCSFHVNPLLEKGN